MQHQEGYFPLSLRTAIVPVANFGSTLSWPLIIIGLFFNGSMGSFLINLGVLFFTFAVIFQLVTLPVEFNASSRAMRMLEQNGILSQSELPYTRKVLSAAALTYVASAAAAILQLLRLLLIVGGRNRND
jgi:hypothetical protein